MELNNFDGGGAHRRADRGRNSGEGRTGNRRLRAWEDPRERGGAFARPCGGLKAAERRVHGGAGSVPARGLRGWH
jgi:hypothetical protein